MIAIQSVRCARVVLLAVFLLICAPARADIQPTGFIFIGDGTLGPEPGDLDLGPLEEVFLSDPSALLINNGSVLSAGSIGTDELGTGDVVVTGAGSTLNLQFNGDRLNLRGAGTFEVLDGGLIEAAADATCAGLCNIFIGEFTGANATLNVSGASSTFSASGTNMVIGQAFVSQSPVGNSTAVVNVTAGGLLDTGNVRVSAGALADPTGLLTAQGTVNVSDQGSVWNADAVDVGAGVRAQGNVTISNGGLVDVTAIASIATDPTASGSIQMARSTPARPSNSTARRTGAST